MFHFYLTLAYIVPNIYVFFRIMNLFITKRYRILYILIYLLLIAIYPVSESILRNNSNSVFRFLSVVSDYLLPFYLYLFLSILIYDLFLLINHFIKLVSVEVRKTFSVSAQCIFNHDLFIGCYCSWWYY